MMFCPNCGSQTPDNANHCANCGASLNNSAQYATNSQTNTVNNGGEQKSKLVAGLLGIFLGSIGIHNFYLGFTTKAVIQIIVTLVSCGLGSLWGFIEGILILCGNINADASGNPLKE